MKDEERTLKIALASGLPKEFQEAIALGNSYQDYRDAKRYLSHLNRIGLLDQETLQVALTSVDEYFAIRGLNDFQGRLRDDELSNLGAVSNTKGYDIKNDIPLIKDPEERITNVKELMKDVDSE